MGGKNLEDLLTIGASMDEVMTAARAIIQNKISEIAQDVWDEAQESGEPVTPESIADALITEMFF